MAVLDLNDPSIVAAPPYFFSIEDEQYAIALITTASVGDTNMILLKAVPGGHQTIYAQVPGVTVARVEQDGGIASFVQWHLDRFNVELKKRHPDGGIQVDDIFSQIARFLQENVVVVDRQVIVK